MRISLQLTNTRSASNGITSAATAWISAVIEPISKIMSSDNFNGPKPNQVGVPTAPKDTGTEFMMSVSMATFNGLKPKPIRIGAAMAAGVPKPLAPSIIKANAQPIIISCATGFGLMLPNHLRIISVAPDTSLKRLNKIAPKITVIGVCTATIAEVTLALMVTMSVLKCNKCTPITNVAIQGRAT